MKGVNSMEDKQIVQLFWDRNEQAIEESSMKYGNYCRRIARNILQSEEDVKECVNDTWLNAWNAIPPHRPSLLSTFLGKLTRNLSLKRYQKNTREKRGGHNIDLVWDELEEIVSGKDDPALMAEEKELKEAINQFLRELPKEKRIIFLQRYWYAFSIAEISARTGMSKNNVSVSLSRLRDKLKAFLYERGYDI